MKSDQPKISVIIRKRPLLRKELAKNESDVVKVEGRQSVVVSQLKEKVDLTKYIEEHNFTFDRAYSQAANNEQLYLESVRPLVEVAFLGARVTCFAYGQTGSGKTFTMNGDPESKIPGLYVLAGSDIFSLLKMYGHLSISVSFFQIYCGKLFDLLNDRQALQAREDAKQNVNIVGLLEKKIYNVETFMQVIEFGSHARVTACNSANADSSRSHAILQIFLKEGSKVFGKISFIDLAGCERGADVIEMNKQTKIDGSEINKSLLALKECIRALDQGKTHTPFRQSKLTMVLKDSFVGFSRTVMIGNISPSISACENTLNTLRYADRVKELRKPSEHEQVSKEDKKARELMLPRMEKNSKVIMYNEEEEEENKPELFKAKKDKEEPKRSKLDQALEKSRPTAYSQGKQIVTHHPIKGNLFREQEEEVVHSSVFRGASSIGSTKHSEERKFGLHEEVKHATQSVKAALNIVKEGNKLQNSRRMQEEGGPRLLGSWNEIVQQFEGWVPRSGEEVEVMRKNNKFLIDRIMEGEEELIRLHRQSVIAAIDSSKCDMGNIKEIEEFKIESQHYVDYLVAVTSERIKMLNQLRNLSLSQRKMLEDQARCEERLKEAEARFGPGSSENDDELLLSGIEEENPFFSGKGKLFM